MGNTYECLRTVKRSFVKEDDELSYKRQLAKARTLLRLSHGGSCPFGSCILKRSSDSCSYSNCPYRE